MEWFLTIEKILLNLYCRKIFLAGVWRMHQRYMQFEEGHTIRGETQNQTLRGVQLRGEKMECIGGNPFHTHLLSNEIVSKAKLQI